jgi:RNA polymerase sigma-70 factor (ECF subfamily)
MAATVDIKALIDRVRAGDRAAYAEVVKHYERPLFGFLGRMGLTQAHAEEVAQETFLRAWRNLGDYDAQRAAFSTWLFTMARNLALNELACASNRYELVMGDEIAELACQLPQPLALLLESERKRLLQAALRQLPLADRSALALAYTADLDLAAVARIEGSTTGAIKTRLHRAKQKLRELLEAKHG